MKEFLIELQALLEKHNAVITYDTEEKISFEVIMGMGSEQWFTNSYTIDSHDILLHLKYKNDENNEY